MECVCFPLVDPRMANGPQRTNQPGQQQCCEDRKPKGALDLCKIVKRSRDNENNKHSEYECHLKGERRQNLINKIKMYLDDYDDRQVLQEIVLILWNQFSLLQYNVNTLLQIIGYNNNYKYDQVIQYLYKLVVIVLYMDASQPCGIDAGTACRCVPISHK